jgi:antitoxin component YwqK of YwqJK toxin-antitoxin module
MTRFFIILLLFCSTTLSAQKDPEKKKRGTVTVYYPNSKQVWYTGQNSNYLKEGTWTYYAPDGKITHTDNYKAGLLNGERNVFLGKILIAKENFSNGKPDGTQRYFYKSGNLKSMFFFTSGNADSARFWNEGSEMYVRAETYVNKEITAIRYYNYLGCLHSTEYYENGKKTGVWKTYSGRPNDTTLNTFTTYKDGKKNGSCRESINNYIFEAWYVNDTLNGPFKHYSKGKLNCEGSFKNGKQHGLIKYYSSCETIEEVNYADGTETGVSTVYSEIDGRIYSKRYFSTLTNKSGKALVDSAFSFNAKGAKTREDLWLRQVNKANPETVYHTYREWFDNGKLKQTGRYSDDWKQFIVTDYYENGMQKSVLITEHGQLNGKAEFWYKNGKKAMEYTAVNNQVTQRPKVWLINGVPVTKDQKEYFEIVNQFNTNYCVNFLALKDNSQQITETNTGNDFRDTDETEIIYKLIPEIDLESIREVKPLDFTNCTGVSDIFPGGDSAFVRFVGQQIIYPAADRFFENSGMIILSLTLSPDGNVLNTYILHDETNSLALQNEALRLMYCTPWKNPSGQKITINIPLNFKL